MNRAVLFNSCGLVLSATAYLTTVLGGWLPSKTAILIGIGVLIVTWMVWVTVDLIALHRKVMHMNGANNTSNQRPGVKGGDIRYGDLVTLRHAATREFLHSPDLQYKHEGGSGQRQVVCHPLARDAWRVKGSHNQVEEDVDGKVVEAGETVRLEHVKAAMNLHTHVGRVSPISGQQEVTTFGAYGHGDTNDNWQVEPKGGSRWKLGTPVSFKHVPTKKFLHSHVASDPNLTGDRQEVTGYEECNQESLWVAEFAE